VSEVTGSEITASCEQPLSVAIPVAIYSSFNRKIEGF
jgi:hypothetical protein